MGMFNHQFFCLVLRDTDIANTELKKLQAEVMQYGDGSSESLSEFLIGPGRMNNGYVSWVLLPDGTKEYWDRSDRFDEIRGRIKAITGGSDDIQAAVLDFHEENDGPVISDWSFLGETI